MDALPPAPRPEPPLEPEIFDRAIELADTDSGEASVFDPRALLRQIWRGLPIMAGTVVLGLFLGFLALRSMPPKYTSTVSILIDPKAPGAYGAEGEFASLAVDEGKIADVEEILSSSQLLRKVVEAEHLADDPEFTYGGGFMHSLSEYLRTGRVTAPAETREARTARAIAMLDRMMRVSRVSMTYVITVSITADTAERAQHLAAAVGNTYISDQLETKYAAAHSDAAWLQFRLGQIREELEASEERVEAIRKKYGLVQTDSTPGSTLDRQSMTELNDALSRAQADVALTGSRYLQAQQVTHHGGSLESLSDVAGSKLIEDLRSRRAAAATALAELSVKYAPNYPLRRQAQHSLDTLDAQIAIEVSRVVGSLRNDYQAASSRAAALQAQLKTIVTRESDTGSAEGRLALREAERIAEVNLTTYQATLNHLRDVEQQETRQEAEARIISYPELPEAPSSPRATICLGAGGIFGLFAGLALVLFAPGLRSGLLDAERTQKSLRLPVLAVVPTLRRRELGRNPGASGIPDYVARQPFSLFAESLRRIRLGIRAASRPGASIIQITSAVPGEGKSTIAASLAVSYAASGARTVLVDLDLHQATLTGMVAETDRAGLIDVLLGDVPLELAIARHAGLPLWIVPAGSTHRNTPEIIEGAKLKAVLADLATRFDIVVVDCSPVLAVSDPLLLAGLVDVTVLVAAWRSTARDRVSRAVALLRAAGAPLAGCVLNRADLGRADEHGQLAYGYYHAPALLQQ